MVNMHEVLFVGGFANSGKSTLLKVLKENYNCQVFSSSELLHNITSDIFSVLGLEELSTHDKTSVLFFDCKSLDLSSSVKPNVLISSERGVSGRDILIGIAEKVLVKHFTRKIFTDGVQFRMQQFKRENPDFDGIFVVETIGGLEFRLLLSTLLQEGFICSNLNVHSKTSKPEADGRELLPNAYDLYNPGTKELSSLTDEAMVLLKLSKHKKQLHEQLSQ